MNRIDKLFEIKKEGICSVYFTAGFPNVNDRRAMIESLERNGIDLIEIGIPFSDPMADGAVIQASSARALQNGMTLKTLFDQLSGIRKNTAIPLVMMGYLNPIMRFGFENFCREAQKCGIDGLIIPDLPFAEYLKEYKSVAEKYGLHTIMLITPQTSEERIRWIDENTGGFIYMVSSASVTGAKQRFSEQNLQYFNRIHGMKLKNPRLIGFGISNKTTFDSACENAAGAIIGSKFVSLLQNSASIDDAVRSLIKTIRE